MSITSPSADIPSGQANKAGAQDAPPARPLSSLRVVERFGASSSDLTRMAVSWAGYLAMEFGAQVVSVRTPGDDRQRPWPPAADSDLVELGAFLGRGKATAPADEPLAETFAAAYLITDDSGLAASWPTARVVLVRNEISAGGEPHNELTAQARTGLLDIFAGPDGRPRPLPGHQIAYTSGTAALNAVLAGHLAELRGQAAERVDLSVVDIALWINWKHYMSAVTGDENVGLRRKEDWSALRCADGHVALTFQDKDMQALAQMTGDEFFLSDKVRTRSLRAENVAAINERIERWAARRTRQEIVTAAQELRIPVGPVLGLSELSHDVQFAARGFLVGGKRPRLPLLWNGAAVGAAA